MIHRLLRKIKSVTSDASIRSFHQWQSSSVSYERLVSTCDACREQLRAAYEDYVNNVSRPDMAASLELGALLLALCKINRWQNLLDLGSGFSSYVFRLYARQTPGVTVYSVDDDPVWLKRTSSFLTGHQLSADNLVCLDDFLRTNPMPFDCILHDLNFVEVRIHHVEELLRRLSPGGVVIFDDAHKADYRAALMKILSSRGTTYSLRPVTQDNYGRYALAFAPRAK